MDVAYFLILLGVLTSLGEGIVVKSHGKKYSGGFIFTGIVSLFSMLFFLVKGMMSGGINFDVKILPYALLGGFLYAAASVLTYEAFMRGSFALSNLILSYTLVFSVLYGLIFQNEAKDATVFTYIGFFALALSIYLVNGTGKKIEGKKPVTFYWLLCIILSFVGSGMFSVVSRIQQRVFDAKLDNEFMVISLGFSAVALIAIGLIKEKKGFGALTVKGNLYAVMAGAFNGLTNTTGLIVNTMFAFSGASVLRTGIKLFLVFLISVIFYKEKFTKLQIAGAVLGGASVILFNL